jgi:GNAT superfamily N-acetyltransferase
LSARDAAYLSGGAELLDEIGPLWERLQAHHEAVSPYKDGQFASIDFAERKAMLARKAEAGALRVDIARARDGSAAGYCVSSMNRELTGEIDSLFVLEEWRGRGVGRALMESALRWMDAAGARSKIIGVGRGNEQAFGFYEKFGFLPRVTILRQTRK